MERDRNDEMDEKNDMPDFSSPEIFTQAVAELIVQLKKHPAVFLEADLFTALTLAAKTHGTELGRFLSEAMGKAVWILDKRCAIYVCEPADVEHLIDKSA